MAQVTLQAVVNFEQVNQLQQRIDKLNGTKVTIGVQDFTRQMQEAGKATGEVKNQLSKVVRVFDANGELLSGSEKYQKSIGTTVEIMQKMNKETEQLEETGSRVIRDLAKEQKSAAKAAEEHAKYVAECNREYEKYQQYLASQQKNTPIQDRIDALTGVYRDDPVTRKEFTDFGRLLIKQEEQVARAAEKAAEAQKKEEEATAGANTEVKKQGLLYDILGRNVSSFVARMIAYRAVYAGIRAITNGFREALQTLKAVDDELVTVRKVTGFDEYQMARVEEQAYAVASRYGTSASDYTSSVAAFARAGYKDLSGDLAELAEKTKIVGDTTAEVAQQFLLSVDAAYKYKGNIEALTAVLDGANEIDNKYATSIEKIAEGMGIVAPVAAQMHVGVDELAASIGTITAITQRTGTEAARSLRAIYLNIVGDTKTEIEEGVTWTTGEIEGLRDVIKLYAKDAWDAAQASGGIIDPMEAIAGLSKSVKDGVLTEAQLMEMVSDIGGKLRTSQLLALINNWDMYESMLKDYRNAYGSAEKEIENAMDSWTRKSEVLKNTWTQFVKTGLNSDAFKGFLDILTSIVQRLGTLPGVLTRIAVIVAGMKLPQITKSLTTFFADIKKNGTGSINGLSAAITGLGVAWSIVSYIIEDHKRKHEEMVAKIYEEAEAAEKSSDEILELYADFNSAKEGSDALADSAKRLAEALGEDIPEGAEAAGKALDELTLKNLQSTIEKLGVARATAENEFQDILKDAIHGKVFTYENYTALDRINNGFLPEEIRRYVESVTAEFNRLKYSNIAGYTGGIDVTSIEEAVKVREAYQSILDEMDAYMSKHQDYALLESSYYKSVREFLSETEEAYKKYYDAVSAVDEAETKKRFLELSSTIRVDSVEAYEKLIKTIDLNNRGNGEQRKALIALAELYYPQYTRAIDDATESVQSETEALEQSISAAERAAAAKKEAEAAARSLIPALWDEAGALSEAGIFALEADQNLAGLVQSELEAELAAKQANYSALVAQLAVVGVTAADAAQQIYSVSRALAGNNPITTGIFAGAFYAAGGGSDARAVLAARMAEINRLMSQISTVSSYAGGSGSSSGGGGSGGGSASSAVDEYLAAIQNRISLLKSELSLMKERGDSEEDQIAKMREIMKILETERQYLISIGAEQIQINNLEEEWWRYQNQITDLQEQAANAAEREADAIQAALDATIALHNAERQRSVRVYNASTGQWEWTSNPSTVASAREAYNNALSGLSDSERAEYERLAEEWRQHMVENYMARSGIVGAMPEYIRSGMISSNLSNMLSNINNGATYNMGGVTISEAQAKSMSVYDFAQLSGSLAAYNRSV